MFFLHFFILKNLYNGNVVKYTANVAFLLFTISIRGYSRSEVASDG